MAKARVAAFVDGFNLYHSIENLNARGSCNHFKWLDLRALVVAFTPSASFDLVAVKYFSAFAKWLPDACKRHRAFVSALRATGVETVMGRFKEKDRYCMRCGNRWKAHEEKETDVNIAIHALNGAYKNEFDTALLITADSDLAPAIRMVKAETGKKVRVVFPIGLSSSELSGAAGPGMTRSIKSIHLERNLLPREVKNSRGEVVAVRPAEYDPPA